MSVTSRAKSPTVQAWSILPPVRDSNPLARSLENRGRDFLRVGQRFYRCNVTDAISADNSRRRSPDRNGDRSACWPRSGDFRKLYDHDYKLRSVVYGATRSTTPIPMTESLRLQSAPYTILLTMSDATLSTAPSYTAAFIEAHRQRRGDEARRLTETAIMDTGERILRLSSGSKSPDKPRSQRAKIADRPRAAAAALEGAGGIRFRACSRQDRDILRGFDSP